MSDQPPARPPFLDLPEGTVTFLFTDIEGSTRLLEQLRDQYAVLLEEQRDLLRLAFTNWNGREIDTQGDAFFVAFGKAIEAVNCVVEAQRLLAQHAWPQGVSVRVRMGLHTGEPVVSRTGYVGMAVHRAARIAHAGHGGQVLLSEITTGLVVDDLPSGARLVDLGRHLLKDLNRPEHIYQLEIEGLAGEFPALKSIEQLPPESSRQPRKVGANPYRGLFAFCERDAPFFFGRETFVTALEQAVRTQPMVAVIVGSSGSGKSSALFAGLLPRLRGEQKWQIAQLRPGGQPFYALAAALIPLLDPGLSEIDQLSESSKLAKALEAGEIELFQIVERLLAKTPGSAQLLLVIDQFEELYTLSPDEALQRNFINILLQAVATGSLQRSSPLVLLLTMRADFMGQALGHRPFADILQKTSLLMGPMTRQELHEAVERPAELQGAAFEPGLVERILDDVGESAGNLPLLQFALTLLWEGQHDGWLTHADYESIGCVDGALARYADEVYDGLDETEQSQARRIFVQLVIPGEGTEDTRRVARQDELGSQQWRLVQHLADRRLVVTGRDSQSGIDTVEVVHEALIQRWGRLKEWMQEDRNFRTWQERLRAAMHQWEASQRDNGALLRGGPLVNAEEWLESRGVELAESEREYIRASAALRASEQYQRERRRRVTFLALGAGLVVALILAAVAFLAFRKAQVASLRAGQQQAIAEEQLQLSTSRELAAAAVANLHIDPERSVLLALEGLSRADTLEARNALHKALPELRILHSTIADNTVLYAVSFSPDGTRLATSGIDSTAKIWDASNYQLLFTLKTNGKDIYDVKWSPDGMRLATSGITDVIVWDAATGQQVFTLPGEYVGHTVGLYLGVGRVDFSPDGTRLAAANQNGVPKVWDLATRTPVLSLAGSTEICSAITYNPAGTLLATGCGDGIVKIWNAQSGRELRSLQTDSSPVAGVAFNPDGTRLVAVYEAGYLIIWEVASGETMLSLANLSAGAFSSTIFNPDGSAVVTTAYDGTVRVWDAVTGRQLLLLAGHTSTVLDASVSPDGRILATGGVGGVLKTWDLGLGREVLTLDVQPAAVGKVAFAPDGRHLAAAATDGKIRIWDRSTKELVTELSTDPPHSWKGPLAYTRDGSYLAAGASDGVWALWDLKSGRAVATVAGHTNVLQGLAISPDGLRLATSSFDGTAKVWDILKPLETSQSTDALVTFTKHIQPGTSSNWVFDIAFSPDGRLLASVGADSMVRVWDPDSGQERLTLPGGDGAGNMTAVAFSPDGRMIAAGQLNGVIRLWDAATGKLIRDLPGHSAGVFDLDFSADSTLLASASFDMLAKIWDLQSGGELASLFGHNGRVMGVAFSPDGMQVATGGEDGTVRLYDVRVEDLVALARSRVTRSLTAGECQRYLHVDVCPASP